MQLGEHLVQEQVETGRVGKIETEKTSWKMDFQGRWETGLEKQIEEKAFSTS